MMSLWGRLAHFFGRSRSTREQRMVRAIIDAARTTPENRRHWAAADGLSADAAYSADVRDTLRRRARYEAVANSYLKGIALSVVNETIGTGPRLQVLHADPAVNEAIEAIWSRWAGETRFAATLRTMRHAKLIDGEAFAVLATDPGLAGPVKLKVQTIESDRVCSAFASTDSREVDGIRFDSYGRPQSYRILREHPGGTSPSMEAEDVSASSILHWFRADRPEQSRGIPEITPALPLFAMLRRYNLAVLAAAETAADYAVLLYTDAPAGGEAEGYEAIPPEMEIESRMMQPIPAGWRAEQMKPQQPASTHEMAVRVYLREIARCLCIPACVALGDSSGYNYASGRLDFQVFRRSVVLDQHDAELVVLDRVLWALLDEASMVRGLLPSGTGPFGAIPHIWTWDAGEHVDPSKEADAQEKRLKNLTTSLADEYAKRARDWEAGLRQIARERALMRELNLSFAEVQQDLQRQPAGDPSEGDEEEVPADA